MALSLSNLRRKNVPKPPIIVIYGPGGMGKTTLASEFPNPIFLQTEAGEGNLDITSFTDGVITDYGQALEAFEALATEDHGFQTLVIDSITRLEPLIWRNTCTRNKWSDIEEPGYGKGYLQCDVEWAQLMSCCGELRDSRGMTIIMLAHETVQNFKDPMTDSYDSYSMRLQKRAEATVREMSDVVGFLNQVTVIKQEQKAFGKKGDYTPKGAGNGIRALSLQPRPAFDAKNRYGMPDQVIINPGQGYAALAPYLPGYIQTNTQNAA